MRPNVILIVLDTARADAFEPYGATAGSSPAIADLAGRGAAFEAVHANACWTLPSHASLFTGRLPWAAGMHGPSEQTPAAARPVLEAQAERMLPQVLRRAGYDTRAVSTNLWVTEAAGFAVGFDRFHEIDSGRQAGLHRAGLRSRLAWDGEAVRAGVDDGAAAAGALLRGWAAEPARRPFFWFVNLVECHSPYLPPRPWSDGSALERLRAAEEARRYLTMDAIWRACAGGLVVPAPALARMRRLYARAIKLLDDWVADLLGALDAAGTLDRTLVAVTSDHGENFGEGGLMAHAFSLDQRLLRVPFIAAGPGLPPDPGAAGLCSVPRLIATAIGLDDHPWRDENVPDGVAVAQFEPPAPAGDPRWDEAFSSWGVDPAQASERLCHPRLVATDGKLKLQRHRDREQLFELTADPLELAPVDPSGGDPAAVARLRAALDDPGVTARRAGAPAGPAPEIAADERRELERRMRLLGYM